MTFIGNVYTITIKVHILVLYCETWKNQKYFLNTKCPILVVRSCDHVLLVSKWFIFFYKVVPNMHVIKILGK